MLEKQKRFELKSLQASRLYQVNKQKLPQNPERGHIYAQIVLSVLGETARLAAYKHSDPT